MAQPAFKFHFPTKIYKLVESTNAYGEQVNEYEYLVSTRCNIKQLRGRKQDENLETTYDYVKTLEFRIYIKDYLKEFYRVELDAMYEVIDINADEDAGMLVVQVQKVNV